MQTKYTIVSLDGKTDEELRAIAQELGMKDIPSGRDKLIYAILDFQAELQAEVGKEQASRYRQYKYNRGEVLFSI